MKNFLLLALLVSSLLLSSLTLLQVPARAKQEIIRVPADYPTIQQAINAAVSGSIILVTNGTYYEHLVVNKTLTLIGQDKATTIIDGNKTGTVVYIKANNVTINGFTLWNGSEGVHLEQHNSTIISNNIITLNENRGILLNKSSNNLIDDNLILRNGNPLPGISSGGGIRLDLSNNNTIINNIVSWNVVYGVALTSSCFNLIVNNTIEKSAEGIAIWNGGSKNNTIYHNNFIWNSIHVEAHDTLPLNFWDDGTTGNYWDDYTGLDDGSNGRITGDGVGDTDLPHLGVDNYPLINPWGSIPVIWENKEYPVTLLSNSTISEFRFIQTDKKVTFNVRGPATTFGFCNVTIPRSLLRGNPWRVLLNNTDITSEAIITENQTHTLIYFIYNNSAFSVQIIGAWVIPEFSSTIILPFFIAFSTFVIIFAKKKSCKKIKT
jgi:parallel beta-helix repeat protein